MRPWLSGLLVVLLAVTLAMGSLGGGAMAAPSTSAVTESVAPQPGHGCCTAPQDSAHQNCAACAAIGDADRAPAVTRLSQNIRFRAMTRASASAAARLPVPPPRHTKI